MIRKTEVLVVGAGPAGVVAAIAAAKKGSDVIMIDSKELGRVGDKTCGDGLTLPCTVLLEEKLGIGKPSGPEIEAIVDNTIFSVDDFEITFPDDLYIIDRRLYGQRLLQLAQETGVTMLAETKAIKALTKKDAVRGALVQDKRSDEVYEIHAHITIDCSGKNRCLSKSLPRKEFPLLEPAVDREVLATTYREIITLKDKDHDHPRSIKIVYDRDIPLPAYFWIFPKGSRKINVGMGQPMNAKNTLRGTKKLFKKFLHKCYPPGTYEVNEGKGDLLPMRYPLMNCVANGFLTAGDAAFHANPFSGEGHGPALIAGYHAGIVASKAVSSGECTADVLWEYNMGIMQHFVKLHVTDQKLADAIRDLGINNLKFILKKGILRDELAGEQQETQQGIFSMIKTLFSLFPRYGLLIPLVKLSRNIANLEKHLDNYPKSPRGYEEWNKIFDAIMRKSRANHQ
ncbi:MAG: NAD(P)/FAD-dependent oxidoreductase [Candidatus Hodarchaeales archaeon]